MNNNGAMAHGTLPGMDQLFRKLQKTTHVLKTWPEYFQAVISKLKPFEIRKNDRNYKVGDILHLKEYDPELSEYTGAECFVVVTYITSYGQYPDNVVMGISIVNS